MLKKLILTPKHGNETMIEKKSRLLLGAHMSISGGFEKAIEKGSSINCTTIQIFTKSNRQWNAKPIPQSEIDLFQNAVKTSVIKPVIAHATYLINIGSSDDRIQAESIKAVSNELERCHLLDIPFLVLHPGSHTKTSEEKCIERIARNLDIILEADTGNTKILLENMAGQGSSVCYSFDQIATVRKNMVHPNRVGVCFDTCHAFAAGYDFSTPTSYKAMWEAFDNSIGLKHLYAMHLNDSKKNLGSRVDRHEDIGKGAIGLDGFEMLMNDSRFFDIPKILETPSEDLPAYAHNMQTLKNLLSEKTKKELNVLD